jgi:3-deoxy-D-manno-octulosonic acid (KDO) 8-phosphate synthase
METHVNPAKALSDASNAIAFKEVKNLWKRLLAVHAVVNGADVEFDGGCSHK